ncbi:acetylxylan esterase [Micromonospora sp. AMSO31t]|uniref:acetylxylan esterase n=1 Tax=Micromonospora sp. AMSO31t TaxID=2650566 RepID=UPI001CEC4444|nr:acetylxylan esterase [Micromonospora sp. AMSO31t]
MNSFRIMATIGSLPAGPPHPVLRRRVAFARRAAAPAHFGIGLRDRVCPPSTGFAAYHQYGAATGRPAPVDREIHGYPFNQHEGGEAVQVRRQLRWLARVLGAPAGAGRPVDDRAGRS